jgi:hypothetical protein
MTYLKYPRTYHLPWSPNLQNDDRMLDDVKCFEGKQVNVSVKLDGENTTMYRDHIHARSLDSLDHPTRSYVKQIHGRIAHEIPDGWRVCGENMYAKHSIHYKNLEEYFYIFSIWTSDNICLSCDEMNFWAEQFELPVVPTLYEGPFGENEVKACATETFKGDECEGYVVRLRDRFHYEDFETSVAKYVRKNHVQTNEHWMRQMIVRNGLRNETN